MERKGREGETLANGAYHSTVFCPPLPRPYMRLRRRFMAAAAAILFAGQTLLAPVATAQNLPNLGGSEREDLSPLMERKLGEQVMRDIRRDRDYLNDAPTLEYLNDFGNSL